jgi:tRNA-splicing ligase RtcB
MSKIKWFTETVPVEDQAKKQVENTASLSFVEHIAIMPDVHLGKGATIGSVIATKNAIIPSAVGVDIGCGMNAVKTSIKASQLPDNLFAIRSAIESVIPVAHKHNTKMDTFAEDAWLRLSKGINTHQYLTDTRFGKNTHLQLGTLGGGNHFVEICIDENDYVWIMLHSGSRNVGNRIGTHFIAEAKLDMEKWLIHLPDADLAYIPQGSNNYQAYIDSVSQAQDFAMQNRVVMMQRVIKVLQATFPDLRTDSLAVNCHHNYIAQENHFGKNMMVTRKGAVRARKGDLGIIPGSMGARSFIVRGLGNAESMHSCSHGAGRVMSRTEARKIFTKEDLIAQTKGVECRKDSDVIDEIPAAYKNIDDVMYSQRELVEIVATLRQVICVKG